MWLTIAIAAIGLIFGAAMPWWPERLWIPPFVAMQAAAFVGAMLAGWLASMAAMVWLIGRIH